MLQILSDYKEAKNSNLVFLIKNKFDIEKLNFLLLDEKILFKIEKIVEEQKNTTFRVYL
jgi:hypothetical protein